MLRFASSLPKHRGVGRNEDAAELQPYRGLYAVSDGASESFAPALWSRLLAQRFLASQAVDKEWLGSASRLFASHFDREGMTWSAQASFDRGTYATLLGLRLGSAGRKAEVVAVGDSLAVLSDGPELLDTFPYTEASDFARRPLLLSTQMSGNGAALANIGSGTALRAWDMSGLSRPAILCMTDALGAWLLQDRRPRLQTLLSLRTKGQFSILVDTERAAGRMRRDDTTLILLA